MAEASGQTIPLCTPLTLQDDLSVIVNELAPVASKWELLGACLPGLNFFEVKEIKEQHLEPKKALLSVIERWLSTTCRTVTWEDIFEALRKPIVQEIRLVEQIKEKICSQSKLRPSVNADHEQSTMEITGRSQNDGSAVQPPLLLVPDDPDFEHTSTSTSNVELSYRCLDTRGMSESERSSLRGRLTNDYKKINSEYSMLNRSIRKSLRDRKVTPQQLGETLMEINAFALCARDKSKPLLADRFEEIDNAKCIDQVFKILRPYGSFFDCYVIKHIVESELCTEEDRENLRRYMQKLQEYCQRHIYECPHFASSTDDQKFRTLVMKMDEDIAKSFTIKALDAFRDELAITLNLKPHTLHLCSVEKGCLQLTFQVPAFVKEEIFPLSNEQKVKLQQLHIQRIDCEGNYFIANIPVLENQLSQEFQPPLMTSAASFQIPTTGMPGSSRYCYIHRDGITPYFDQNYFTFQHCYGRDKFKVELERSMVMPLGGDSGRIYEKLTDSYSFQGKQLHTLLELQDRALSRRLQVFLKDDYVSHIGQMILEFLKWLSDQRLTPKLEGRFGLLPWRQNIKECTSLNLPIKEFADVAFGDHFLAKISEEDAAKLREYCYRKGGSIDSLETYDFKLTSPKFGKLDIRLKFSEGKPEVITVKKYEYKVAIFDIACFNSPYDMRVSLNTYQSASTNSEIASKFASTVTMDCPGTISFVPKPKGDEWRVAFIRHKKIDTLFFNQPKYAVSVSTVGQYRVKVEDFKEDEKFVVKDTAYEQRSEAELHNLCWEVMFGRQIGLSLEESLVLFTSKDAIPRDLYSVTDEGEWSPRGVTDDFMKDGFMKMMEEITGILGQK